MSDAVLVAIISGSITLIGIIVSLIGIFVSAKATRDDVTHKLDTNQQLIQQDISHVKTEMGQMKADIQKEISTMKTDIKSHNNYAKLFNENIPVIKEKLSVANHRIEDIEGDIKYYHRRPDVPKVGPHNT